MQYLALLIVTALALSGCAHRHPISDVQSETVKVGIGQEEVAVGDRVELFKMKCYLKQTGPRETSHTCDKTPVGEGTVTEVLSEKESRVKPDAGTVVTAEMYAEKLNRKQ